MEFKSQEKKALPVIILIDSSFSMNECMGELNEAVNEMTRELKKQESPRAEVKIVFITFGGEAKLHSPLTSIQDITDVHFEANGRTPLGAGLRIAKEIIEDKGVISSSTYRPMVILLSDGEPTDEYESVLNNFTSQGRSQKCERLALGIGEGYNPKMLSKFSTTGKIFEAKDAKNVIDFFKFVTMTIKDKTISSNPNKTEMNYLSVFRKDDTPLVQDRVEEQIEDNQKTRDNRVSEESDKEDYSIFD